LFDKLPSDAHSFMTWSWSQIEPYFTELLDRELNPENISIWLSDWTRISDLISERYARLNVAITLDTTDENAEKNFYDFLDDIYPHSQSSNQKVKDKMLASGIEPDSFDVPIRKMRTEAKIFRAENLQLITKERKLVSQFNKIIGSQTVFWDGKEITLQLLQAVMQNPDRGSRKRAWLLAAKRQLEDRSAFNQVWEELKPLRVQMANNAGYENYRSFRWQQMLRLDYSPQKCIQFQEAIEKVVVPAATRVYESHRRRLGLDNLRPWDLRQDLYPFYLPPLPGYGSTNDLVTVSEGIFYKINPTLGQYFNTMRTEGKLDLDNRKGKAPGGYCTNFPVTKRPFIFMNAVGLDGDIRTLLHEAGHAFHNFERFKWPYAQQRIPGLEFAEVASMSMELLTFPYLSKEQGGFFNQNDAKIFKIIHLEHILTFWPYMAVVDAFQHWAYTNQSNASNPENCDAKWLELWDRFIPGVDWSGLKAEASTGWHRKPHIYRNPFYYLEYGLAQLAAVQVWKNSLIDPEKSLKQYRYALSLGGTVSLPDLYEAVGARLSFDEQTLIEAVDLIESKIQLLENE